MAVKAKKRAAKNNLGLKVGVKELEAMLAARRPLKIVDVRSPGEYRSSHVPGAQNVPLGSLNGHVDELRPLWLLRDLAGSCGQRDREGREEQGAR